MKRNKLYMLSLLAALFFLPGIHAQTVTPSGLVIINTKAAVQGDTLSVDIHMDVDKIKIKSQEGLVLTPIVRTADRSIELPAVFVGGKNKYKAFRRKQAFGKNQIVYVSVRAKEDETSIIDYNYVLPYDPWMEKASVALQEEIYGCADCLKSTNEFPLLASIDLPLRPLWVAYVTPPVEIIKSRNMEGTAYLDFEVNKSVILPDFRRNPSELAKIDNVASSVNDNRYATITSIDLTGYASPEGPYELNERLSKERAFALKEYLQNKYGYKADLFNVTWKGEDWGGLRKAVEASDLQDKAQILNIIDASDSYAQKDRKMKSLSNYRTLLSEYYPPLRRVDYRLNYTIRAFTVEEGIEVFKTSPAQLSLNEMFLVANQYPKGSKEFNNVFDAAVRIYPLDPIANINAAAIELEKGDARHAHRFLDPYESDPRAWNNIGVMYLIEGNFDRAAEFLNKALTVNEKEARHNLDQLNVRRNLQIK